MDGIWDGEVDGTWDGEVDGVCGAGRLEAAHLLLLHSLDKPMA